MSVALIAVDVPIFVEIYEAVIAVNVAMDISFNLMDVTVKVNNSHNYTNNQRLISWW